MRDLPCSHGGGGSFTGGAVRMTIHYLLPYVATA